MLPAHIDPAHCIVTGQYAVYTPPMHEMIQQIGDWIDQQTPGGYIAGASRLGKTKTVQWHLTDVLEERFHSSLPLVVWSHRPDSHKSESFFWHQLLAASHFEFLNPVRAPKKAEGIYLLQQRLISIANHARRNYVILLIDEAQDITYQEWKWLVGLQNQLDYEGCRLSVFSVGSHQLDYKHEYMASTGNAHVAARFMSAYFRFHGLRAENELEYVLNAYDVDSEWPLGSGLSFLQYFAPGPYSSGRRLANIAPLLWKALAELSPSRTRKYREFPMQHVAKVIEAALLQLANGDDWEDVTSYENWLDALAKVNFSDHMRIISTAG